MVFFWGAFGGSGDFGRERKGEGSAYDCGYVLFYLIWWDLAIGFKEAAGYGINVDQRRVVPGRLYLFFSQRKKEKTRKRGKNWKMKKMVLKSSPRNAFVVLHYMVFRPQRRDHGRSVCSSSSGGGGGLDTVAVCLSTGHFDVVLIHGSVQKPIRIGGRDQVDGLIFEAVQRRR